MIIEGPPDLELIMVRQGLAAHFFEHLKVQIGPISAVLMLLTWK